MSENNNQLAQFQPQQQQQPQSLQVFNSMESFANAQRMAQALCSSALVPDIYKGNIPNTLIALEMANRIGASPLAVMQNLNIINGRPSWGSSFIIAALQSCGRFEPLEFEFEREGKMKVEFDAWTGSKKDGTLKKEKRAIEVESMKCWVVTRSRTTGRTLEGPPVTIEMAVREGWYTKSDSKWQTMPELMIRYRAAAFFGRLYAPDVIMGMHSSDEVADMQPEGTITIEPAPAQQPTPAPSKGLKNLTDKLKAEEMIPDAEPAVEVIIEQPADHHPADQQDDDLI